MPTEYDATPLIAEACHEINRAYCAALGDHTQPAWAEAPDWQKSSAIDGVRAAFSDANRKPQDSHAAWLAHKQSEGWHWGRVKDPEKKEHPCMVPFEDLSVDQQAKDHLFLATARMAARLLGARFAEA